MEDPMRKVIHVADGDLETDTIIRIDNLEAMITILRLGIEGDDESVPTATILKHYLFHLGQEVDLIRQNLTKVTFQKNSETEETHV
jgi:hypothetical protein